jgi:branched-subunit amino acid transport protein
MSWWLILAMGAVTFAIRFLPLALIGSRRLHPWVARGLELVPPAVLSAIILPELLFQQGAMAVTLANPRLVAGLVASLVARRTKNVVLTLGAGMVVLWLLTLGLA